MTRGYNIDKEGKFCYNMLLIGRLSVEPEQGRKDMYTHARQAFCGLVLSVILMVLTGIVAWIDPWNNGVPWVNWLAVATGAVVAIAVATGVVIEAEDDIWQWFGAALAGWLVIGVGIGLIYSDSVPPDPYYAPLVWSVYAVAAMAFCLAVLMQYFVTASEPQMARPLGLY